MFLSAACLVATVSVWGVDERARPIPGWLAIVDGILIAAALSTLVLDHRDLSARDLPASVCVAALIVSLVRFGLAAGAWTSATAIFQSGTLLAILATCLHLWSTNVGPSWFALMSAAAALWIAGTVDRSSGRTFVPQWPRSDETLASRGGVLAVVVFSPTAALALAYAEGRPCAARRSPPLPC